MSWVPNILISCVETRTKPNIINLIRFQTLTHKVGEDRELLRNGSSSLNINVMFNS